MQRKRDMKYKTNYAVEKYFGFLETGFFYHYKF